MTVVFVKSYKMVNGKRKLVLKKKTLTRSQKLIRIANKRSMAPKKPKTVFVKSFKMVNGKKKLVFKKKVVK